MGSKPQRFDPLLGASRCQCARIVACALCDEPTLAHAARHVGTNHLCKLCAARSCGWLDGMKQAADLMANKGTAPSEPMKVTIPIPADSLIVEQQVDAMTGRRILICDLCKAVVPRITRTENHNVCDRCASSPDPGAIVASAFVATEPVS